MIGRKNNMYLRTWSRCPLSRRPARPDTCTHADTQQRCGQRTPERHHTDISELSPIPRLSITSNPPKTWRIKAESITHSSLHSALLYREITAEGEKQSQDPILSRRKAPAFPEDVGRTLLSSLWLTHNKKKKINLRCCDMNSTQV